LIRLPVWFTVLALLAGSVGAGAQSQEAPVVKAVTLSGLERVSEQFVRSRLKVQAGQPYDPATVAQDLRELSMSDLFNTVTVLTNPEDDGLVVTYVFEEKPVIDEIKIIGNNKMRTRSIRAVLSLKEGNSFTPEALDEERQAILDFYKDKGYPNASVDIIVDKAPQFRVKITYAIDEGKKARIRSVAFEGNYALSKRQLKKVMKTKRGWLFFGGRYNEDKLEADIENLMEEYKNYGRLEVDVGADLAQAPGGKKLDLTISISEGPEYSVETLDIANDNVYADDEIRDIIAVHQGDVHNKGQIAKDAELIEKGYQDSGYINASVETRVTTDLEKKTTRVTHDVDEDLLKYIGEITVTGNSVTRDDIVRRQLLVVPGERYDGSAFTVSEQRLKNTEYFNQVNLTRQDDEDNDLYTNVFVDVADEYGEEGKTGNFIFGPRYHSEEKFSGFAELRLNNFDVTNWPTFSGGGQVFSAKASVGSRRDQYNLSFTDPEFAGYPLAFGFDFFSDSYEYSGGSHYTEELGGGQLRLGKALSPYVTARTSLRYTDVDYSDLAWRWLYAPELGREFEGSTTVSNTWSIERNTLDIRRDPTTGSTHMIAATVAGLGGDNDFLKLEHDSTWYRPLGQEKKWILSFRAREGWADEYGSSDFVPMWARFFAGGSNTVRGYDNRDIGPKVREFRWFGDREAVGGKLRLVNNLEVKYKLTEMFRLYAFADAGGVWRDSSDFDLGDLRYSVGLGFGVDIPKMGPVRIDYGFPLNPDDDQGSGRLHILTGFRF